MSESRDHSPGDDYFNDLSQQRSGQQTTSDQERRDSPEPRNGQVPKPKRIACVLCRRRKLKCDGIKPSCGTCARLQHECVYDEVRRKSGPKRGYVKALEARLAQVETLLKTQDDTVGAKKDDGGGGGANGSVAGGLNGQTSDSMVTDFGDMGLGSNGLSTMLPSRTQQQSTPQPDFSANSGEGNLPPDENFPWEMIGLGLDEPLPTQDVINELNQAYFDKVHPSLPMIHRPRFYAAMNLAPHMRPPVCLRYAMWCNAAAVSDKFDPLAEHFYYRARKYIQQDEMKGHGESLITVAHCQTWVLLATHEFKLMYFPRAWMSAGRACRLALMMGLHRLDGAGLDVKQCLAPPRDWTEREERRRTFWMSFCVDRYSSIGTGWPMVVEEGDIRSSMPSSEEAFDMSKPAKTMELADALRPDGPPQMSSFGGVVLMACLFGRNLTHLHRPGPDDRDDDLNGEFWKRHRDMDNILLNTSMSLPDVLRLPAGMNNPHVVFMNMNIHTSTICLHQAAIFKADRNRMPPKISAESKVRCITAASEIASIMRQISHLELSSMNPFISFCLYVAARVFVQYLKSRPNDGQIRASLQFLLMAMHVIKKKNPLTESFLVQLDVDLEGAGLDDARSLRSQVLKNPPHLTKVPGCPAQDNPLSSHHTPPTYGDQGLAMYNQPNTDVQNNSNLTSVPSDPQIDYAANMSDSSSFTHKSGIPQYELPNRGRTPGSTRGSSNYKSPDAFNVEMDTSPDGSGGNPTPGSTSQSDPQQSNGGVSRQSNTSHLSGMLGQGNHAPFTADFNMHDFPSSAIDNQQHGFILSSNWPAGPTSGMSPGGSGNMMNSTSGIGDMMGMTDADWNQVLDTFSNWESGIGQEPTVHMLPHQRRM